MSELGFSRSTGYRLLDSLAKFDYIERTQRGTYVLGSFPGPPTNNIQAVFTSVRDSTGESVQLWIRQNEMRVCVYAVESEQALRISKSVGTTLRLVDGGSAGLALASEPLNTNLVSSNESREPGCASTSLAFEIASGERLAICVSYPSARRPQNIESAFQRDLEIAVRKLQTLLPGSQQMAKIIEFTNASIAF